MHPVATPVTIRQEETQRGSADCHIDAVRISADCQNAWNGF